MLLKIARSLIVCWCILTLAAVTGCGADEEAEKREQAAAAEKREAERERREAAMKARAEAEACQEQMEPLVDELAELNSRLGVGLSYDEYTNKVGDVRVAYDNIDYDELGDAATCLSEVGVPAEKALNQYVKAASAWGDCFDDIDCSNDTVDPTLQRHWSKATPLVERAKDGLREVQEAAEDGGA